MKAILSVVALVAMMTTMSSEAQAAQCKADVVNGRGMVLDTFRGYGYDRIDACQEARRDCRRAIRAGYYRGRILNCEVRRPVNRIVHKTCRAIMRTPRGHRVIQTFLGQASGPRGSGVKAQACERAVRQCLKAKRRSGRVHAICSSERRRGGYSPMPRPLPRRRGGRGL